MSIRKELKTVGCDVGYKIVGAALSSAPVAGNILSKVFIFDVWTKSSIGLKVLTIIYFKQWNLSIYWII